MKTEVSGKKLPGLFQNQISIKLDGVLPRIRHILTLYGQYLVPPASRTSSDRVHEKELPNRREC